MTRAAGSSGAAPGLIGEVRRYLVAVELFRAEGLEPRWLPERHVVPALAAAPVSGGSGRGRSLDSFDETGGAR